MVITNYGYARTSKERIAYYKTKPYKAQYEKILAVNEKAMEGV